MRYRNLGPARRAERKVRQDADREYAKTLTGATLQIEDAKGNVCKQLSQAENFIANGVTAIIVDPVDTSASAAISKGRSRRRRAAGSCQSRADLRRQARPQGGLRRPYTI